MVAGGGVSFYGTDYDERGRPVQPGVPAQGRALRSVADDETPLRAVNLIPASRYPVRRVRWLYDGRIAVGTVSLLAGREGLGKSTIAYWLAARITCGQLPGEFEGEPRPVFVCATEDSWSHTIVPRLIAAGADLNRVLNVEIEAVQGKVPMSLPVDVPGVRDAALETGAALMLLDPLMSRLSAKLDTHRDQEVRQALEPLAEMAEQARMAVLGLIHLNKGGGNDPLNAVMASKAFTAVARSVSMVVPDPDDETGRRRLFATPKNNLGRDDLPMLSFTIGGATVESEDDGEVQTSRVMWGDEVDGTVREVMTRAGQDPETRTAVDEAGDWLEDWIAAQGGEAPSKDAKAAGKREGHSEDSLKRAVRRRATLGFRSQGTPRQTVWFIVAEPEPRAHARAGGDAPTALTAPTGPDLHKREGLPPLVGAVGAVGAGPREAAPTDPFADVPAPTDEPPPEEDR